MSRLIFIFLSFSQESGFEVLIPGRVLLFKDHKRSFPFDVELVEIVFYGVISDQLFLELGHRYRTPMLEASDEPVRLVHIVVVVKIDSRLPKHSLKKRCIHGVAHG